MAEQTVEQAPDSYEIALDETVTRDGREFQRIMAKTPWFTGPVELADVLRKGLGEELTSGGTAFICEKLAVVGTGRTVDASTVKVGRVAKFASKFVRPIGVDLAQQIPERMQFVMNRIGWPRTILACAAAAVTRPFGVRGAFFVIAGREARDLDGMHEPYWNTLLPPLRPKEARQIVDEVAGALGTPVAVVDINDRGGHIRAVSAGGMAPDDILAVLDDNPMGHCQQSTPIGLLRTR